MMPTTNDTLGERITRLETEMLHVLAAQVAFQTDFKDKQNEVDAKLDTLLSLKDKGTGVFWLASTLAGVGAISIFFQVLSWVGTLLGK